MKLNFSSAFTLIELLVVITIIVVLLALLTPALDKAIYKAELVLCAANQDSSHGGLLTYTLDHKRRYPNRTLVNDQPVIIKSGIKAMGSAFDDRPQLVGYVDLDAWVDPLVETIDMDIDDVHPDSWVYSPMALWYGFRFRAGMAGMNKLGDRFTWFETIESGDQIMHRFDFLVTDKDGFGEIHASHPDADGAMYNMHMNNEDNELESTYRDTGGATALSQLVASFWRSDTGGRGELDLNYLHDDGSVTREIDVGYKDDSRMIPVPNAGSEGWGWNGGWSGGGIQFPR